MSIRTYKATTPSRRNMTNSTFEEITTSTPEKSLLVNLSKTGGRNNNGCITTRHIGGGHKRRYRIIDFKRNKDGVPGTVATIEYDPNRNANICLVNYVDGEKRYIICPKDIKVGQKVMSGTECDIVVGNEDFSLIKLGKAGKSRWKGVRPTVRGSVMNPNDHPHGGGEGKCPVGRDAPRTPWGKRALGVKTRRNKKASTKLIVRRAGK